MLYMLRNLLLMPVELVAGTLLPLEPNTARRRAIRSSYEAKKRDRMLKMEPWKIEELG